MTSEQEKEFADALWMLRRAVAFNARDMSVASLDAVLYGVLLGWDEAFDGVANAHEWSEDVRVSIRRHFALVETFLAEQEKKQEQQMWPRAT